MVQAVDGGRYLNRKNSTAYNYIIFSPSLQVDHLLYLTNHHGAALSAVNYEINANSQIY